MWFAATWLNQRQPLAKSLQEVRRPGDQEIWKSDPGLTTRAVDNDLRDLLIREFFALRG